MKIGFFTEGYLPQPNGVATSVFETAKELRKRGHEVTIIAPFYPGFKDTDENVIRLPSLKVSSSPEIRLALNLPDKNMRKILTMDFDIIHGHSGGPITLLGWEMAKLKKIPFTVTYHTLWNRYTHYFLKGKVVTPKMLEQATKIFGNQVDRLIAPSLRVEQELRKYGVKKPISVVPSGIDTKKFITSDKEFLRKRIGVKNDPIILFVGRLGKEKSVDFLINVFAKVLLDIPTAHFVIVGEGQEKKKLEKLASKMEVSKNVHFTGDVRSADMEKVYKDASIFVFASTTETQGLVLPEALASGVPVVAVDDPAFSCIENGKNGFLVKRDLKEFAEKIVKILKNDKLQNDLSKNAVGSADQFSIENSVDLLEEAYFKLIDDTNRHSVPRVTARLKRSEQFFVFQLFFWASILLTRGYVFLFQTNLTYPALALGSQVLSYPSVGVFMILFAFFLAVPKKRIDLVPLILFGIGVGLIASELASLIFVRNNVIDYWNALNLLAVMIVGILPLIWFHEENQKAPNFFINTRTLFHKNPEHPKISVVIPAYNEGSFIETTLRSLLVQTYKNFELIVVDNNSTDNTSEVAEKFGAKVVFEREKGVAAARQAGFYAAKGEIIACTDSDTIVPENWVEKMVEAYDRDEKLVAFGGVGCLYSGPVDARVAARYLFPAFSVMDKFLSGGWNLNGFNLSVKRDAFLKIGGFRKDLIMGEDIDLAKRLRGVGKVGFDLRLSVNVSGRRYKDGLIVGVMTYVPSYLSRVLFRKEGAMKFPSIRSEKTENKLSYLPLIITLLILSALFHFSYSRFL